MELLSEGKSRQLVSPEAWSDTSQTSEARPFSSIV